MNNQLTKLEQIAAMCLQGLLSNSDSVYADAESIIKGSISIAQDLIATLPKQETRRKIIIEGETSTIEGWLIAFSPDNDGGLQAYYETDSGQIERVYAEFCRFLT